MRTGGSFQWSDRSEPLQVTGVYTPLAVKSRGAREQGEWVKWPGTQ